MRHSLESLILAWAVLATVLGLLFLLGSTAWAGVYSPAYLECLERDTVDDLLNAHRVDQTLRRVQDWELRAVDAITRSGYSKNAVDVVRVSDTETAAGWAHFTVETDRLGVHTADVLPYLYSDVAGAIQLRAWRRIVGPAIRAARANGWRGSQLALAGAVANTSPTLLVRLGVACEWESECVEREYQTTDHRRRRVAWLRGGA